MASGSFSKSTKIRLIREEVNDLVFVIENNNSFENNESYQVNVESCTSENHHCKNKNVLNVTTGTEYSESPSIQNDVLFNSNVSDDLENSLINDENIISSSESDSEDN